MRLADFESDILNFFDFHDEAVEEKILKDIAKYAESVGTVNFAKEVNATFANHGESGIGVIYEALSKKPEIWGDFYVNQYKLTFKEAENTEDAFAVLDSLEEVCFAEDTGFGKEIIKVLEPYLNHAKPALRYKAVWYMADWIDEDNKHKYPQIIRKIKEKLQDDNWKIRVMTVDTLRDLEELPDDFSLTFFDKMRAKFGSIYEI